MNIDPVHDILPDLPVMSVEGRQLGTVKEVTRDRIKVDASLEPDYWISRQHVLSFTAERVTLDFNADQVSAHKAEPPESASGR